MKREGGRILCEEVSSSLVNDKQENLRTKRIPPNWTTIAVCRPPTCPVWWARKGIKKPHYVSTFKTLLTLCTLHSAFCIWRAMLAEKFYFIYSSGLLIIKAISSRSSFFVRDISLITSFSPFIFTTTHLGLNTKNILLPSLRQRAS